MPAYIVRFRFGPLPTTLLELVLVPAVVVGAAAWWRDLPWHNRFTWPALLLLAAASLDTAFAPDRVAALGIWKAYFVEPVAAALVLAAMARSRPWARLLLAGIAAAGAVAALANIAVSGSHLLGHSFDVVTPPVAIYNSANDVPLFLEPPAAFAFAVLLHSDRRLERVVAGAFYALAAAAILLSYSRLGWISLGALTLFVALFSARRLLIAGAAAGAAVGAFALSHQVRERVLVEFRPGDPNNTIALRLPLWRTALDMLLHHPLLGGGLSGFKAATEPYRDPDYHEPLIYPHNLVLNWWSETGLLGLAAFAWLCVQLGRAGFAGLRAAAGDPWRRALAVGVLAMLLVVLLHGIGDVPYFKNDLSLCFWALAAIALGATASSPGRPGDNSQLR